MRLSINGRVVKSNNVEIASPRMVECKEGFQQLGEYVAVLNVAEEEQPAMNRVQNPVFDTALLEKEAQEKAAKIVAEAVEKAEAEAQKILGQAQSESERLREEVKEKTRAEIIPAAREEGYQAGKQEGYRAGYQAGEAEGKDLLEKAQQLFHLAQRAVHEEYAKVDQDLLGLAIKIAERLVRSSLDADPQKLLGIIHSLMLLPQEREGWRLHVAAQDAVWLEGLPEGTRPPCPWIIDESLSSGDCFLECQEGIFDARLEAQLDKLQHSLREELTNGSVEQFNQERG